MEIDIIEHKIACNELTAAQVFTQMKQHIKECKCTSPLKEKTDAGANVPLDRLVMPRALTAENGAKGLLSGEFHETVGFTCPDCDGDHDLETDQCGTCEDTGECAQEVPISWSNIKDIYAMAVKHLGA